MHLEINTKQLTSKSISLALLLFFSKGQTENKPKWKFSSTKEKEVLVWQCTTLMKVSKNLLTVHLSSLWTESILCIWPPRTPFWRSMMANSRTFSNKFMKSNTKRPLKQKRFGMSIDWLMTWLRTWWNQKEDSFGPAKTMTEMFKAIVLLRVLLC